MHMHIMESYMATLIMSFSYNYSCVVLVNANFFNKIKCADCSIRVYRSFSVWVANISRRNNDNNLGGAIPVLYHSILQYFILSIAIVIN